MRPLDVLSGGHQVVPRLGRNAVPDLQVSAGREIVGEAVRGCVEVSGSLGDVNGVSECGYVEEMPGLPSLLSCI